MKGKTHEDSENEVKKHGAMSDKAIHKTKVIETNTLKSQSYDTNLFSRTSALYF